MRDSRNLEILITESVKSLNFKHLIQFTLNQQ